MIFCPSSCHRFVSSTILRASFGCFTRPPLFFFDDALSIFLSHVLLHYADGANFEEPRINSYEEKYEVTPTEEKDGKISDEKCENELNVQFEIPEMGIALLPPESSVHCQIECSFVFPEITDV